jgi:predicted outer membrane repeat protein
MKKHRFNFLAILVMVVCCSMVQTGSAGAVTLAGTIFVNAGAGDGLAAHWKFDEVGSTTALDFAGGNPAVLQDTANLSNTSLPPLSVPNSGALTLDGINDYAQINAPTAVLSLSTSFSLTAWLRRTATNQYDAIYDSGTQANKWWVFIADNSGTKNNALGFGERGIAEVYSTQPIIDANWHHIAVIKNGDGANNISFYVDGIASGSASAGAVSVPTGSARIGGLLEGTILATFGGNLDDLRLYNRALSAAEVARLAAGQGCVTDGASWSGAFRELQCALSVASAGQEIWLAGGIYRPGTARGISFNLVNGANLLGGFAGTETLASQRPAFDPNAPLTRLSGDILGDDNPIGFVNYAENSRNVVIAGTGVGATVDGLAIQDGNNDGAAGTGAGLQIQAGAAGLTLNNVVVSGSSANDRGGGIENQAPLTLINFTLSGNRSVNANGGGLYSSAAVNANNPQVVGNNARSGGGFFLTAPLVLIGGVFDNNRAATFTGGGIQTSANLTISGVTFSNNQAAFSGGAMQASGSNLDITSSTFSSNKALTFTGGAIEMFSTTLITNSVFTGNTATQDGGAINGLGLPLTIQGSNFIANQALGSNCLPICSSGSGGAIATIGDLTTSGVTFTNNTARLDGGAIAINGGTASLTNTGFTSNAAGSPANSGNPGLGRGGAIFSATGLTVNSSNGASNSAQAGGGAIYAAGPLQANGGLFQINNAVSGGAFSLETGGTLANLTLLNNTATTMGGGIVLANGNLTLNTVVISGNNVLDPAGQGGGLNISAGTVNVNGGAFISNSAFNGGDNRVKLCREHRNCDGRRHLQRRRHDRLRQQFYQQRGGQRRRRGFCCWGRNFGSWLVQWLEFCQQHCHPRRRIELDQRGDADQCPLHGQPGHNCDRRWGRAVDLGRGIHPPRGGLYQ